MCLSKLTAAFVLASESRQKLPQDLDLPPTRTARRGLAVADLSVDASARPPRARARRIQPPENLRWALPTIKSARRAPPGRAKLPRQLRTGPVTPTRRPAAAPGAAPCKTSTSYAISPAVLAASSPRARGQPVVAYVERAEGLAAALRLAQEWR